MVISASFASFSRTQTKRTDKPHTALISLEGTIMSGGEAGADRLIPALEEAYDIEMDEDEALAFKTVGDVVDYLSKEL